MTLLAWGPPTEAQAPKIKRHFMTLLAGTSERSRRTPISVTYDVGGWALRAEDSRPTDRHFMTWVAWIPPSGGQPPH